MKYTELDTLETEELENAEFEINDDATAEWALKKVLSAKRERERLLALIKTEREDLDRKEERAEKRYEADTSYLLSKLNAYLDKVERKKTKTQESYQLLSGKLVRKFATQKLVPDDEALLEWCKKNAPEYIKHEETPMWSKVKSKFAIANGIVICAETGECVTCVSVEEKPSAFEVKGD